MSVTYKIGEAAGLLNLKTYVLRFWETEFPQIAPLRTEKGQRLYTDEHIALLRRIRHLLHERGLTIEGARRVLAEEAAGRAPGNGFGRQGQAASLPLFGAHDRADRPGPERGLEGGLEDAPEDGHGEGEDPALARHFSEQPGSGQRGREQSFSDRPGAAGDAAALHAALQAKDRANARLRGLLKDVEKELAEIAGKLRRSS